MLGNPAPAWLSRRSDLRTSIAEKIFQNGDISAGSFGSGEVLDDVAAAIVAQPFTKFRAGRELDNGVSNLFGVLGLNKDSSTRILDNLACLSIYPQYHWPGAGHKFQHFGRNYSLENFVFFHHYQGSDVADYEFICDAQFAAQLRV